MEEILSENKYEKSISGVSVTGNLVEIIGEQTVRLEDGRIIEQYVYNIIGYTAKNGKPFVALKCNIFKN